MDFVVIPTLNERENIPLVVPRVFKAVPDIRLVVVDDGSTDGSQQIVEDLTASYPNLIPRRRVGRPGLANTYLETMQWILDTYPTARTITTMDADLSHDPAVIPRFLEEIERHDLVIGSRYIRGGKLVNWPLVRKILSIGGNIYATFVSGTNIHDLTSGFQCFRTELLRAIGLSTITAAGFAFQMEMKIAAARTGARIKEIPITFTDRVHGVSKISNRIVYEGLIMPWKLRFKHWRRPTA